MNDITDRYVKDKIRNINVTRDELFGWRLHQTFLESIHYLRDVVATRLDSMTTGYSMLAKENNLPSKKQGGELVQIELMQMGTESLWYLIVERDGTVSWENRRSKNSSRWTRYTIPAEWTDEQIEDFEMPVDVVKAWLARTRYIPESFKFVIARAEKRIVDSLSAMSDKELSEVRQARINLNESLNALASQRKAAEKDRDAIAREKDTIEKTLLDKETKRNQIDNLIQNESSRRTQFQEQIVAGKEQLNRAKMETESLRKEFASLRGSLTSAERDFKTLLREVKDLEDKIASQMDETFSKETSK